MDRTSPRARRHVMRFAGWAFFCAGVLGCTSEVDFAPPVLRPPIVDKSEIGKPYIKDQKSPQVQKAERLAQILAAWQARPREAGPFVLGPNDVIEVSYIFFAAADVSDRNIVVKRTIPQDGVITLPWAGDIQVIGLTARELEARIRAAGTKFVKNPQVTVEVVEYRSSGVYVVGAVQKPGVYYLAGNRNTVLDLIGQAGGLQWGGGGAAGTVSGAGVISGEIPQALYIYRRERPEAPSGEPAPKPGREPPSKEAPPPGAKTPTAPSRSQVEYLTPEQEGKVQELVQEYLRKEAQRSAGTEKAPLLPPTPVFTGRKTIVVDLRQLLEEGNLLYNVELQNDDVVVIPPVINKYIWVAGYVQAPGIYVITDRMRVDAVRAVIMAGGLADIARAEYTWLIRETDEGLQRIQIDLIKMFAGLRPPVYLEPGDMLVVGTTWYLRLLDTTRPVFTVGSEITRSGKLRFTGASATGLQYLPGGPMVGR